MGPQGHALRIERVLDHPRERVFRAWSDREQLAQWFHFNDEWKIAQVEVDFRVGGRYRIGWKGPDGSMWYEFGEYREIKPPEKIVHTCNFDFPDFDEGETLVTLELRQHEHGTLLILIHEGYRDATHRDMHQQGWPSFIDQLVLHLQQSR